MLFRSSPLCSDQREDFIDFGPKLIFDFAMFPVPISLMKVDTSHLTRVHIAFHDVILGVLVAFWRNPK
jgi:hypothetical protein